MNETEERVERVSKIFDDRKELFKKKNKDYGCSYVKTGQIMELILDGEPLNIKTAEDHIAYQLIIRKLDKLVRFCNLRFTGQENLVHEKIADTMSDDGNYAFMLSEIEESRMEREVDKPITQGRPFTIRMDIDDSVKIGDGPLITCRGDEITLDNIDEIVAKHATYEDPEHWKDHEDIDELGPEVAGYKQPENKE